MTLFEQCLSCKSCNQRCRICHRLDHQNHKYLIGIHVSCVVITSNHNMITPTIFFQLPVAVQLSLSLNPVAAVCPQSGLGLSNYGSAWGEARQQLCYGECSSDSELQVTINVRVDLEQCVMGQLILKMWGETGRLRRSTEEIATW